MNFRKTVAILIVFLFLAGLHLLIYAQNIGLKYQLTDLKTKLAQLNSLNRSLSGQTAAAENLTLIEKIAREKLEMIYPEKIIYIVETGEAVPKPK